MYCRTYSCEKLYFEVKNYLKWTEHLAAPLPKLVYGHTLVYEDSDYQYFSPPPHPKHSVLHRLHTLT